MSGVLAIVDHDRGALDDLSRESLTFGRRLAEKLDDAFHAALVGAEAKPLAGELGLYGVSVVHLAVHERLDEYAPGAWAASLTQAIDALGPDVVVAPGSDRGHEVLANVAARMDLPMAANCVEVHPGEPYRLTRQRWGGSLLEEAELSGSVKLLTVAPQALPKEEAPIAGEAAIEPFAPILSDEDLIARIVERVPGTHDRASLSEARVVIGGGRGVGSAEGFAVLEELAELLGAAVGGSRVATSLGWRPHSDQIGQTGTRIAPDLYVACGISGAIQHIVGAKRAKRILAVNTDPDAPIMRVADYAVIGDLHVVLPAVVAEIERVRR